MRRKVYRSLDQATTVFGIRGRFLLVTALGGAFALILGLVGGRVSGMLAGAGTGILIALASYFATLVLLSRLNEKDFWKILLRRSRPTLYRVRPKHIRNLWRGFNLTS